MIQIKHLNKSYNMDKENGCEVLKGISLHIKPGELVAIMGASGAGKSTLLHIMAFIDKYDNGQYFFDGQLIDKMSDGQMSKIRNEKIGIVMQDFALIEDFTSIQNVLIPLDFARKNKRGKEKRKAAQDALESVQMGEYAGKPVKKLSGGQKQRVAIARAIVNKPQVLFADEPTGALDSGTGQEIMELFKKINESGQTIVIVTHDSKIAEQCDRTIEIADGKVRG
ncbi:MAG: ABC transporter ATP-binding protein [Lachnospiraceae bacterium]|nr:ABC transporter ATP-binding protein [Lachnospiraceae bacterium]